MHELLVGHSVAHDLEVEAAFRALMNSAVEDGDVHPDEDLLEDAVAFEGVAKYPARIKCALLSWMAWKDAVTQALARGSIR